MAALPGYASMITVSYGFLPRRVCARCGYEEIFLQLFSIIAAVYTIHASFLVTDHNYISKEVLRSAQNGMDFDIPQTAVSPLSQRGI